MNFNTWSFIDNQMVYAATAGTAPAQPEVPKVTLKEALEVTVQNKLAMNRRPKYVHELRRYLRMFIRDREQTPIALVTVSDIEAWFDKRGETGITRVSNGGRLSSMFNLAFRRGWIPFNPCLRLDKPLIERKAPVVLTPEQAAEALRFVYRYGWFMPNPSSTV